MQSEEGGRERKLQQGNKEEEGLTFRDPKAFSQDFHWNKAVHPIVDKICPFS